MAADNIPSSFPEAKPILPEKTAPLSAGSSNVVNDDKGPRKRVCLEQMHQRVLAVAAAVKVGSRGSPSGLNNTIRVTVSCKSVRRRLALTHCSSHGLKKIVMALNFVPLVGFAIPPHQPMEKFSNVSSDLNFEKFTPPFKRCAHPENTTNSLPLPIRPTCSQA